MRNSRQRKTKLNSLVEFQTNATCFFNRVVTPAKMPLLELMKKKKSDHTEQTVLSKLDMFYILLNRLGKRNTQVPPRNEINGLVAN